MARLKYILMVMWLVSAGSMMSQNLKDNSSGIWSEFQMISPQPNSAYHHVNRIIALRHGSPFEPVDLMGNENAILLEGSSSGLHSFSWKLSSDNRTFYIFPEEHFDLDETVTVSINVGLSVADYGMLPPYSFSFTTSKMPPAATSRNTEVSIGPVGGINKDYVQPVYLVEPQEGLAPGQIFINSTSGSSVMAILDSAGSSPPLWWMNSGLQGNDFKVNRNNKLTYFDRDNLVWRMMDEFLEVEDTFDMINGYSLDNHDFQILPDGKHFMFSYDTQIVDMSLVVVGGDPNAEVEGFVIQELDAAGDLMLEWRSWDHINITDNTELDLTSSVLNLFHINAVEIDTDGHVLISLRNTSEIIHYHRETGQIFWRWGGSQNVFTYADSAEFSFQHDIRRLDNGNLLMFDNANLSGQVSSCVEYSMNEVDMTVEIAWQEFHDEQLFGASMGGSGRLDNGNTIIYWGNVALDKWGARVTEVDPEGNTLMEIAYPIGINSYRVPKHEWFFDPSIIGCDDPEAENYNPDAPILNTTSCIYDLDGDGFTTETGDCDDNDFDINPDAEEIPYDGIDQDCDGMDLTDVDNDGFTPEDGDCNDEDEDINPDGIEIPYDGIDQDCSGEDLDDLDEDGFSPAEGDCNDEDEDINPDAEEIPNDSIDQDCDGYDLIVSISELDQFGFSIEYMSTADKLIVVSDDLTHLRLSLFQSDGKLVFEDDVTGGAQISVDGLTQGVYLIQLGSLSSILQKKIFIR